MELRHLRYFVAVAELLHFGKAARRLRIAQPSLSQQIRRLESELGTSLFERNRRQVALTDAGRAFLEEARELLVRADRAALSARRAGGEGLLRIGIGLCMDPTPLASAVAAFRCDHHKVRVEVQTMPVRQQLLALAEQRLDVALVRPPVTARSVAAEVFHSEELLLALPEQHQLVRRRRIPLLAVADDPFVLISREMAPVYYDTVLDVCRAAGFVPRAVHQADDLEVVMGLVGQNQGVALVPDSAARYRTSGVVLRPVHDRGAAVETSLAWRVPPSRLVEEFVGAMLEKGRAHPTRT